MTFHSVRRQYLDCLLEENRHHLVGRIIDIGGKKRDKRGKFNIFDIKSDGVVILNPDEATRPDILASIPPIPIENETFDSLKCTEVLEYIYDVDVAVSECARVMKPNGVAIFSVPCVHQIHQDFHSDFHRFTRKRMEKMLSPHFTSIEITSMGGPVAVVFDIIRGAFVNRADRKGLGGICSRVLTAVILRLSTFAYFIDKRCCSEHDFITTGFFIIARK